MKNPPEPEADQGLYQLQAALPEHAEQLTRAYTFARDRHQGQQRRSGEPYITHPLAVAEILAEHGLSVDTVTAGLLHDVLEDTPTDYSELVREFGQEVADIVQGVTKIDRLQESDPRGTQLATLRKLLFASVDDARTLVVKLADRLHNMRTLDALPVDRRQRIAQETLEVYAPIAHRLGMGRIREELEDLCLKELDPRAYRDAGLIQQQHQTAAAELERMAGRLRSRLQSVGIQAQISTRTKSRASIAAKLARRLDDQPIQDVLGMRVVVGEVEECYRTLGQVHSLWNPLPGSFDDYIAVPRANLYQSLHTAVIGGAGQPVEVQIRTGQQHRIAEYGIAAHWLYKETLKEGGPQPTRSFLHHLAESQQGTDNLEEAFDQIRRSVFRDEIYVFTPQGEVRLLPEGACAVDLAYLIHSDLGHHAVGARVNGRVAPLTRPLRSGDRVEIIVGPQAEPSRDWLASAVTPRARSRIRHFFHAEDEQAQVERGLGKLEEGLRSVGLAPMAQGEALTQALSELGMSPEQAAREADRDESRLRNIIRRLAHALARSSEPGQVRLHSMSDLEQLGVRLDGLPEETKGRLARCCNPAPPAEIVARMSLHRGVVIHRKDCRNLSARPEEHQALLWPAGWHGEAAHGFRCPVQVVFTERERLVGDLVAVVYSLGCALVELHLRSDGTLLRGSLVCQVPSAEYPQLLQRALSRVDGALQVRIAS